MHRVATGRGRRGWPAAVVWFAAATCGAVACEKSGGPPPKLEEVPIDNDPPRATVPPPNAEVATPPEPPAPDSSGNGMLPVALPGGGDPVPGTTPSGAAGAPDAGDKGRKKPAGAKLTQRECAQLADKFVELVAAGQGLTITDPTAMSAMRQAATGDPNYAKMLDACVKENTKPQYTCAMRARDVEAWKTCLK